MSTFKDEQDHFNQRSKERCAHGFIPDLDRMGDNDYFYLSPFRRQKLAQLALRPWSDFRIQHLRDHLPVGSRVLDLGCGSGWFSLELARAGFRVTSVDLSDESIALARRTLAEADLGTLGGSATYHVGNLCDWEPDSGDYQAVCYIGSLHHLAEPEKVIQRIHSRLAPNHYMVSHEPIPDNNTRAEAAFASLVRLLFSACHAWYEELSIPNDETELESLLHDVQAEYTNWADKSERVQSPMNNASEGEEILQSLKKYYDVLALQHNPSLYHRLIGGVRLPCEDDIFLIAKAIMMLENVMLEETALKPGGFNLFGRAKS